MEQAENIKEEDDEKAATVQYSGGGIFILFYAMIFFLVAYGSVVVCGSAYLISTDVYTSNEKALYKIVAYDKPDEHIGTEYKARKLKNNTYKIYDTEMSKSDAREEEKVLKKRIEKAEEKGQLKVVRMPKIEPRNKWIMIIIISILLFLNYSLISVAALKGRYLEYLEDIKSDQKEPLKLETKSS